MRPGTADLPTIRIPPAALVMLVGAAASGKSTFARRRFAADSVVSSDGLREALAGSQDQSRDAAVFDRLQQWAGARLAAGGLAVVDATNTDWMWRAELLRVARLKGRPAIAIVFKLPVDVCLARNATRPATVPASVIRRQVRDVERDLDRLDLEGFAAVHVLRSVADVDAIGLEIEKAR